MEAFLAKFIQFFSSREFTFFTSDFNPSDVARVSLLTRLCVQTVGALEFGVLGAFFSGQTGGKATNANLKSNLEELSKFGEVVGIYLKYGQPVMVLAINAENLSDEQLIGRFTLLLNSTQKMREFAMRIVGGKLPSRTLVFAVFQSHTKALHFKETVSNKCKKFSFFNKVWVLPYTVDLERMRVFPYNGMPMTEFKGDLMERVLFG